MTKGRAVKAVLVFVLLSIAVSACGQRPTATIDSNNVIAIGAGNESVERAKQQAVEELPSFFRKLKAPQAGETDFAVKFDLTPGGAESEFIWAGNLSFQDDVLEGALANKPYAAGFTIGQRVTIPSSRIIDWGYRKNGVMQGHYTTRALAEQLSDDEARRINEFYGWSQP
jgi:uncharacterized protein YegJ (DUF2314 family)